MTIIGKTNGAASSEFKLARLAVVIIGAITSGLVALGIFSPEDANQWVQLGTALVGSISAIAAAIISAKYSEGRSRMKTEMIAKGESPEALK